MKKLGLLGCIFALLMASSCSYKFIEPESAGINPMDTVSFNQEILPIFNDNSNCTTCHKAGGTPPDLSEANAFTELSNYNLVDISNAKQSKIYYYCEPSSSDHTWKKYTDVEAETILVWITQGALNN
jgi:hypothetical protein